MNFKINLLFWLVENWRLFISLFCAIVLANCLVFFLLYNNLKKKRLNLKREIWQNQKKEREIMEKEAKWNLSNLRLLTNIEKIKSYQKKHQLEEKNLAEFNKRLIEKEKILTKQWENTFQKEEELVKKKDKLVEEAKKIEINLRNIAKMSQEEAKENLFTIFKKEIEEDLEKYLKNQLVYQQNQAKKQATEIICLALEKYSSELIFDNTVSYLPIENQQMISKIIGKDGRNINFFRKITGTDLIISNEKNNKIVAEISCFNSLRREVATRTLKKLLKKEKISPLFIEQFFQETNKEIDINITQIGNEVIKELQIINIHPELINYLGKLKFRTSYGQNVLEHSLEVASLAGMMAAELGLDISLAKRAGLLHDIGKAINEPNASHVTSGIILAQQFQEPPEVINAIASHHYNIHPDNVYSWLVIAADTLSAARPGARSKQLEAYNIRMQNLENLAQEIPNIEKIYALQAGREVWVLVNAQKINDYQAWELTKQIKAKIQEQIIIPGEINISVIREKIFTETITNSGSKIIKKIK